LVKPAPNAAALLRQSAFQKAERAALQAKSGAFARQTDAHKTQKQA